MKTKTMKFVLTLVLGTCVYGGIIGCEAYEAKTDVWGNTTYTRVSTGN